MSSLGGSFFLWNLKHFERLGMQMDLEEVEKLKQGKQVAQFIKWNLNHFSRLSI